MTSASSEQSSRVKIGIHIANGSTPGIILENPESGNPGIGGTQFLMYALPHYLEKYYPGKYDFLLFAEIPDSIKSPFETLFTFSLKESAMIAKRKKCDIIIFRPSCDAETHSFLKAITLVGLKAIAWMHTTPVLLLNRLSSNRFIIRCVCVGREQYEELRDHPIVNKLSLIKNAVEISSIKIDKNALKLKTVVFVGGLLFAKGFHVYAKMWKKILKYHPDATLKVIGSGKLYDRSRKLGRLGIASRGYERMFKKDVLNKDGTVKKSIEFLGILGSEKYEIMKRACVGVTNHPDLSETFCLTAAELQLCGTPVVSTARGGLLDTVKHGFGGFLARNRKEILEYILKLLSDLDLSTEMGKVGREYIMKRFNYEKICAGWSQLYDEVCNEGEALVLKRADSDISRIKRLREGLRILKSRSFIFRILPPSIYLVHSVEAFKLRFEKFILSIR